MYYPTPPRAYKRLTPDYAEMIPVEEWEAGESVGLYQIADGSGYWVRNGMQSNDSVHTTDKEDATHVAWYSTKQ